MTRVWSIIITVGKYDGHASWIIREESTTEPDLEDIEYWEKYYSDESHTSRSGDWAVVTNVFSIMRNDK
jgi:hypothetical protein